MNKVEINSWFGDFRNYFLVEFTVKLFCRIFNQKLYVSKIIHMMIHEIE